jgi:hypothetical protein
MLTHGLDAAVATVANAASTAATRIAKLVSSLAGKTEL